MNVSSTFRVNGHGAERLAWGDDLPDIRRIGIGELLDTTLP